MWAHSGAARRGGSVPVRRRASGGFTLLEALAASAIFVIVMAAVYLMYESNQGLFLSGESRASAQQNARVALEDMTAAIRRAGALYCPTPELCNNPPDSRCRPPTSFEAVRIATDDTLSLHAGYKDPDPDGGPNQDCNRYVTYTLWTGAGGRGTTLLKETRRDPWDQGQLVEAPLAESVTRLAFRYLDADGRPLPTVLPDPVAPDCPNELPVARPRQTFGLDGQGSVASGGTPSPVDLGSQRSLVRSVRIELAVETNMAGDAVAGCFRPNAGGKTQAFTLVSEAQVRGLTP